MRVWRWHGALIGRDLLARFPVAIHVALWQCSNLECSLIPRVRRWNHENCLRILLRLEFVHFPFLNYSNGKKYSPEMVQVFLIHL